MKAFARTIYGGPEVLQLQEVDKPSMQEGQLLIKVFANSANPADWHILRGEPFFARFTFGLFRPKDKIIGADFAGIVVKASKNVKQFNTGDRVFGETLKGGAFAEYVVVPEASCAHIPEGLSFPEIAGVPIAGLTALQALITHGNLKNRETVLINGASGGVGHFAVQIAKEYGANVTAVCSSRNSDFVKGLGADYVIEYDKEDIHHHAGKYDLIVDTNGNLLFKDYVRMGHRGVMVGFTTMQHMFSVLFKKTFSRFHLAQFTAQVNTADLQVLAALLRDGKIKTHIEKIYSYQNIPEAVSYIEKMRTRGKVVMVW
jgi:NADPH:quinone reductase-like Zn-dependent oxidoreductase